MSGLRAIDGAVPAQRLNLGRKRKRLHIELQEHVYAKLVAMIQVDEEGRPESVVATLERLIENAHGLSR